MRQGIRGAALLLGVALVAGGGALAAVSSGASPAGSPEPSTAPVGAAGVLHLLTESTFPTLDPARLTTPHDRNVGRLLYRSLMTYGDDGRSVVPDLASSPGVSSRGGRTWTFALRADAVYEDGTPVVPGDVVRGFRRALALHAPTGGATATASGPSVVLTFAQPFADADQVATLPAFAPVPAKGVLASGPYRVDHLKAGVSFRLVRNEAYVGDRVVRAQPDEIDGELGLEGVTIDRRLAAGSGTDAFAVTDKHQLEVTTTAPKQHVLHGLDGSVLFTTMNTRTGPFSDVKVRQAFEVAYPLAAARAVAGGAAVGDFATDVLPPFLDAHLDDDFYGQKKLKYAGDPLRAKQMLTNAGYPLGVAVTTVVPSSSTATADALVAALAPSGFTVKVTTVAPARYYPTIGAKAPDLAGYAWSPDWLTPSAYLPQLFTCAALTARDNHNVSEHCDPSFDAQVRSALVDGSAMRWAALDRRLMEEAIVVPRYYGVATALIGKRVADAHAALAFGGAVDLANVTVR
ncbi:MAG: hypothetical protein JWO22_2361 [Frankiales bacterium]|nr:hypothetical protein [Frankiales bacterium]